MKTPSQLQAAAAPMGLKESLIQITDQLRQGIKSETVQSAKVGMMAKKPSAKSNQEEIIIYETSGHDGVAMPLTMEDIEREMAQVEFQLQESTPKEGISTWILLSGTETTPQPTSNSNKGPIYYVQAEEKIDSEKKVDKIMKVKDDKEKPAILPKRRPSTTPTPLVKARPKKTTTTTTTTTETPTTTTATEAPVVEKVKPAIKKVKPESRVNVKRPRRPSTTTTTTTTEFPETTPEEEITAEPVEESTFQILEAKESEFDLPNDRSPIQGKKKTGANPKPKKTKKKPDLKDKKKPGFEQILEDLVSGVADATKKPTKNNKKPAKPMSTQIINYLSREVMPTVGVGLVGLVAAAGIATYFLGSPLTPLRRNDRTDEIYYNNNEEYAGPDGQYEEEWFSKVIAGSPTYRNNLRQSFKNPAPAAAPAMVMQQQANYAAHKYPQYSKYARQPGPPPPGPAAGPGPQYNPNHRNYNVRPNYAPQNYRINAGSMPSGANPSELVRKHSMAMPQNYPHHQYYPHAIAPQPPSPPMAPVREPESKNYFSEASKRHSFSSSAAEIVADTPQEPSMNKEDAVGPIEDNNFLKRTSQQSSDHFVVGSVYPEALTANDPSMTVQQAESVPEHGPRRRRRRGVVQHKKNAKKLDDNELDNEHDIPLPAEEEEEHTTEASLETVTIKAEETSEPEHVTSSAVVSSTLGADESGKVESTTASAVNYYETVSVVSYNATFSDFVRRMFQLKLKLGVSFLRGMADGVARYLHQFEERLYRSTNYYTR